MHIRIVTLVENTVQKLGLIAEHGLSLLISTPGGNLLFDTGQGQTLVPNAKQLGIDLKSISTIVLSHGHSDHTGGLAPLLEEIGPRLVFVHPSAFSHKFSNRNGQLRPIGVPWSKEALEHGGMKLHSCLGPVEVMPGVLATGPIPRVTDFEQIPPHLLADSPNGLGLVHDSLEDDQAVILDEHGTAPVVVLGCSHSGIVNTLLYAAKLTGSRRFSLVIGGTHLMDANKTVLEKTLDSLRQFEIMRIAPCHCTGLRGQWALSESFGDTFLTNSTGDRIERA
jgi:7,8-dihydropterin-6-yl-methyl-4-(beta-D-ribofuranosyl)aminobenzene 5'-phosphate synthase